MGLIIEKFVSYYLNPNFNAMTHSSFMDHQNYLQQHQAEIQANNNYWRNKLTIINQLEPLSITVKKRNKPIVNAAKYRFIINKSVLQEIKQATQRIGGSLFMVLIGTYQILLSKLSKQSTFVINMVHSGRFDADKNDFIGFASQVIPILAQVEPTVSINKLFSLVKTKIYDALEHQMYSFVELCNHFKFEPNDFPFSNYLFNMEKNWDAFIKFNGLKNISINPLVKVDYDLMLNVVEFNQELHFDCNYNAELFSETEIAGIAHAYQKLLQQIITNQNQSIADLKLEYLDTNEYNKIVYQWNKTDRYFPENKTIHELFEEQAKTAPNKTALVYEDVRLTYQELNQRANQLAYYLRQTYQIKADELIALCLDRSENMIISTLAVLKAGASYVPINPNFPDQRIKYILQDTQAKVILSDAIYQTKLSTILKGIDHVNLEIVDNQDLHHKLSNQPITNLKLNTASNNLAYVIYTSGTTGNPKGVMIEHKSAISLVKSVDHIRVNSNSVVLQLSDITFDAAIFEIYTVLLNGAKLYLSSNQMELVANVYSLQKFIVNNKINIILLTKSLFDQLYLLLENLFSTLDYVLVGGEALNYALIYQLSTSINKPKHLINGYGPTENTTFSCTYEITQEKIMNFSSVPIGKPLTNRSCYILDANLTPLPVGAIGELYVGGVGLARGYLNLPELTAERFITNPFQTVEEKRLGKNFKLYKTGDLVRWLPDGNIEYIGRNDFQVKIRGFRIELGEIEVKLASYPGITNAIVLVNKIENNSNNDHYLVGYYVASSKQDEESIKNYLITQLPEYMVPKAFIHLETLPLTVTGKLDRKALPKPELTNIETYLSPENILERELCKIFAEVLDLDTNKISVDANFFNLGGSSITLIKLASIINQTYKKQLSVAQLFNNPNIKEIAKKINAMSFSTNHREKLIIRAEQKQLKRPIIFIHPGHAGAEVYLELLNRLPKKIPCYALDSFNLYHNDSDTLLTTIDAMAEYYIETLSGQNLGESLQIVGWSLGGVIAIEMAHQLSKRGIKIDHVYLLDSILFNNSLREIAIKNHHLLKNYIFENNVKHDLIEKQQLVFDLESRAMINYRCSADKLDFNVTLLKANVDFNPVAIPTQLGEYIDSIKSLFDNGWSKLIPNLEILNLEANHFNLLKEKSLEKIINLFTEKWHQYE